MTTDAPISTERVHAALALAGMFRLENADAARACLVAIDRLASGDLVKLTWHRLGLLLEDLDLGAADEDVWDALQAAGLLCASPVERSHEGEVLTPTAGVRLAHLYTELAPRDDVMINVADIAGLLAETRTEPGATSTSMRTVIATIRRVQDWSLELLRYASSHDLPGFPAFWEREHGKSVPFGTAYGSTASADTVLLWVEGSRYGVDPPQPSTGDARAVERAWAQLLALQPDGLGEWYDGALLFPFYDDDFVDSFVRESAERGACPTVEATAARLYTLLLMLQGPSADWADDRLVEGSKAAVNSAARCLVRWQDDSGGWSSHRYEPGSSVAMPVRDVPCRYAVESLLLGLAVGAFEPNVERQVDASLRRFGDFAVRTAQQQDDRTFWLGDFVENKAKANLRATCLVTLLLGPLADRLGSDDLRSLQGRAVSFLANEWVQDPLTAFEVEFRCPTWEGPALATRTWELPADALMISAVLDYAARGGALDDAMVQAVERGAAGLLAVEFEGSWVDVPMAREGRYRSFPANSLHCLRALLAFAAWQRSGSPPELHTGTSLPGLGRRPR